MASKVALSARAFVNNPIVGLFACYVVHDAIQEKCFRTAGFTFGWLMTFVELAVMSIAATLEMRHARAPASPGGDVEAVASEGEKGKGEKEGLLDLTRPQQLCLAALVVTIAVSQGTGSLALAYINFPVKVAFKSVKLFPTMVFGALITNRRYSWMEFGAAGAMCAGLALLGLSDAAADPKQARPLGYLLLCTATMSDSLIPNLQERLLQQEKLSPQHMVVLSNLGGSILVLAVIMLNGELAAATTFFRSSPQTLGWLVTQAVAGYCGLRCYLTIVRVASGSAAVVATSSRKVLTMVLSFCLFAKPFTVGHALALVLWSAGLLGGIVAKGRSKNKGGV